MKRIVIWITFAGKFPDPEATLMIQALLVG